MERFKATEDSAAVYVEEHETGDKWILCRKPDSRDNHYRLAADYYHTKGAVYGERIDWWETYESKTT